MKAYEMPKMEIVIMNKADVICTSGQQGLIPGGSGNIGGEFSGDDMFD